MRRRDLFKLGGLAALGTAAAACSSGTGGSGSSAAKDVELSFMFWGSTFEKAAIDKMLKAYEQKHAGTTLKSLFTPDDYDVKLNTLVASGRVPDVGYVPMAMSYRLAEQGKLVNLFPYLKRYPQLAGNLPDSYLWDGPDKLHGTMTANEVMLLWYNKQVLAEAGIGALPADAASAWTWDQLLQNAYKLTVDQNGKHPDESGFDAKQIKQFGLSYSMTYAPAYYSLLRSNGAEFADAAGKKCLLDSPEAIEVFQNLQDLTYKHRVAPGPGQLAVAGGDAPGTNILLKTKRVAMVVDGHWSLLDMAGSKVDFGIGVLPKYDQPFTTTVAGASAVFAGSKHVEQAVELFAFHNDPAYVDLFEQGLWMPLQKKYYTDQASIDSWTKTAIHPAEFRTAVVDYTLNHSVSSFGQRLKNSEKINQTLTPALQEIESGKRPAADILKELVPKVDALLQGWQHTQEL